MRKLWPGCTATGMRIGNGAQPRCSGNSLRGADALARRGRAGASAGGEGSAYAPTMLTKAIEGGEVKL